MECITLGSRILRAVANRHTTILGHLTGRQLLRRPGYDVDIEKILTACAAHGVAVEVNANPRRQNRAARGQADNRRERDRFCRVYSVRITPWEQT